jgi:hypothetical protein
VLYSSKHVAPFFETITEKTAIKIIQKNILKESSIYNNQACWQFKALFNEKHCPLL